MIVKSTLANDVIKSVAISLWFEIELFLLDILQVRFWFVLAVDTYSFDVCWVMN